MPEELRIPQQPHKALVDCYCGDPTHPARTGILPPPEPIPGVIVEEVPFCDCTNEELEARKHCAQPHCPGRKENQ